MLINVKPDGTVSDRAKEETLKAYAQFPGKVIEVVVKRYFKKRSNQQNKTVRGKWMEIILLEKGYFPHDAEYIYGQIKMAIGWTEDRVDKVTGLVTKVPAPTAHLNTVEYSEFMRIFKGYVEDVDTGFGIRLPDPDSTKARI